MPVNRDVSAEKVNGGTSLTLENSCLHLNRGSGRYELRCKGMRYGSELTKLSPHPTLGPQFSQRAPPEW